MAQSVDTSFGKFVIPNAYVNQVIQSPSSGIAANGIIMLVGEADAGPDVTAEDDILDNFFGTDALASVVAKYKSGPIVDAFKALTSPSNDPNIVGSPSAIYIAKTNVAVKATGTLTRPGISNYATLGDRSYGAYGNLIYSSVSASQAESPPTTGSFTYIPSHSAASLKLRTNGGAVQTLTISAKKLPSALVGTVGASANASFMSLTDSSLNKIHATGGTNRSVITAVAGTLAVAATGASVVVTISTSWANTPSVGDTMLIPLNGEYGAGADSPIRGASDVNAGAYVVTAATSTTITATKLRNNDADPLDNPANVSATNVTATTNLMCFAPIVVTNYTGTERAVLTGLTGQNVTGTASGSTLTLTLATGQVWAALPQVNDYLLIPATAPAAWLASDTNGGWYRVTAATSGVSAGGSTITLTRLSNGNPASFAATAIAAVTDFRVFRPDIDGVGKSLEIYDGAGADNIANQLYNLSTTAVTWVSTAVTPALLTSSAEYIAQLNASRNSDNVQESYLGKPDIVLKVAYVGGGTTTITGSLTISGTTLTTSVSGGNGSNLSIDLKQFNTLGDLASYINTQTGYICAVGNALYGQLALTYTDAADDVQTILDKGTFTIASHLGSYAGRLKRAGYALFKDVLEGSALVQFGSTVPLAPSAGQPEVQSTFFLSGGAKGATTNARVSAAIDLLERVSGNFLVPLFSRDATDDITDGLTDSGSTYTIDAINALAKTHVLAVSTPKRAKWRQAFLSKKTTFTLAKEAANNIASLRCAMFFQDAKQVNIQGELVQFQPWMSAVLAAGMQAAGFYKSIVNKFINTNGVLMADGTYSDQMASQVEDALLNGLCPSERVATGGYRWVSDQTTYAVDNSVIPNSIQAVYAADLISYTLTRRMRDAFVGQSLADVTAGTMMATLTAIMADLKRIKLIAASDDAPAGFKDASVRISGASAFVTVTVKEATSLYFIPIQTYLQTPSSSA